MNSKEEQKIALLKQMQSLLRKKDNLYDSDFTRKSRLRFNLMEFGEEFLSQEAFDRLTWILEDGGVDLLPMKPLRKGSKRESEDAEYETPKKRSAPDSSVDSNADWMRHKMQTMSQKLEGVENRLQALLQAVETGGIQRSDVVDVPEVKSIPRGIPSKQSNAKIILPIENYETFEKINDLVQVDRDFYDKVVQAFQRQYNQKIETSGWLGVFDRIFGNELVKYYHFMQYYKDKEMNSQEGIRYPIHAKVLVTTIFQDAFPDEDLYSIHEELRKWFARTRTYYKNRAKYRTRVSKKSESKSESEQAEESQEETSQGSVDYKKEIK